MNLLTKCHMAMPNFIHMSMTNFRNEACRWPGMHLFYELHAKNEYEDGE
jgi:hypothetical protein